MKKYIQVEMELEVDDSYINIVADGYIHYSIDTNYGADSDGNRGEKRIFIYDVTSVMAWDKDGNDFVLNGKQLQQVIEQLKYEFFKGE